LNVATATLLSRCSISDKTQLIAPTTLTACPHQASMMLSVTAPHKTYQRLHFGVYINIVSKAAFRITITLAWLANITRLVGKSFFLQTVFMSALCKVQTQTPYCYCGYSILSFSFFYYVTFPHKSFYSLLLRGNERYRVEAATQFAECSQLES